jgi:hypothetical protein
VGYTLIEPSAIPGLLIQPGVIASAATSFTTAAGSVRDQGAAVVTKWSGLSAVYSAPESGTLLGVMTPVGTDTTVLGDQITSIGSALSTLAETVEPIRAKLVDIKQRAETFYTKAQGGITVDYWDSNHPAWDNGTVVGFLLTDFADMTPAHIPWDKYQPWIDENNKLIAEVNTQVALLDEARAACVNTLNGLRTDVCVAPESAITLEQLNAKGAELPWGTTGNGDRSCYESVNDGIGESFDATISGLGSLISRNPETGEWGDWESAGSNWVQMATTLGAIALVGPTMPLLANLAPKGSWGQEFAQSVVDRQIAVVEGLVGSPEAWAENPAKAAGSAGFNIGTFFIPGAGAVGGAAKAGLFGVRVASLVEHASVLLGKGGAAILDAAGGAGTKVGGALTHLMDVLKIDGGSGPRYDTALANLEDTLKKADVDVTKPDVSPGAGHGSNPDSSAGGTHNSNADAPRVDSPHVDTPHLDGPGSDKLVSDGPDSDKPGHPEKPDADSEKPPAHVPPHTALDSPPQGADGSAPQIPDLSDLDAKYREPGNGSIPADKLDSWAGDVSDRYPTLTKDDVLGAYDYTTGSYVEMNNYLRDLSNPGDIPGLEQRIEATTTALSKLPPVPGTTYRGVEMFPGLLDQFEVGKTWSDPAFLSSSLSPTTANGFGPGVRFTLEGRSGVDVSAISAYRHEAEVLFQRGTKFDVMSKVRDTEGNWHISLIEATR